MYAKNYFLLIILVVISCSKIQENETPLEIIFLEQDKKNYLFNDIFEFVEKKSIHFPDNLFHSFSLAANLIFTDNNIVSIDQGLHRIYLFDDNGQYLSTFGREGRGPGEFSFIQCWEYADGVLYLYDGILMKFTLIRIPDLVIKEEFHVDFRISDFTISDNKIIAITPFGERGIISLLDPDHEGKLIAQTHQPEDPNLTTYFARNNSGELVNIGGSKVMLLYPDGDYLHEYIVNEKDINYSKAYTFGIHNNEFRPHSLSFPKNLDPHGYSTEHKSWFESSSHIHFLKFIKPDMVSIIGARYNNQGNYSYFLNLYTRNGDSIAEGIDMTSDSLGLPINTSGEHLIFPLTENSSHNELHYYLVKVKEL